MSVMGQQQPLSDLVSNVCFGAVSRIRPRGFRNSRHARPLTSRQQTLRRDPSGVGYLSGAWVLASNSAFRPDALPKRLLLARTSSTSVASATPAETLLSKRADDLFSAASTALGSFLGRSSLSDASQSNFSDPRASRVIILSTVAVPVRLGAQLSQVSPVGSPPVAEDGSTRGVRTTMFVVNRRGRSRSRRVFRAMSAMGPGCSLTRGLVVKLSMTYLPRSLFSPQ